MMKSAWGSDDPTKAAFPFSHGLALAEAGHEVQISSWGSGCPDADSCGRGRYTRRLAQGIRNAGETRGQEHSHLCLRRLLPGSWRNRGRSQQLRSQVRKSHDLCVTRGTGRQSDYGIGAGHRAFARRLISAAGIKRVCVTANGNGGRPFIRPNFLLMKTTANYRTAGGSCSRSLYGRWIESLATVRARPKSRFRWVALMNRACTLACPGCPHLKMCMVCAQSQESKRFVGFASRLYFAASHIFLL